MRSLSLAFFFALALLAAPAFAVDCHWKVVRSFTGTIDGKAVSCTSGQGGGPAPVLNLCLELRRAAADALPFRVEIVQVDPTLPTEEARGVAEAKCAAVVATERAVAAATQRLLDAPAGWVGASGLKVVP